MIVRPRLHVIEVELARQGWSRKEFARRLKTTPTYVSDILNGKMLPGLKLRNRMMAELKMPFDQLFEAVPEKEPARR